MRLLSFFTAAALLLPAHSFAQANYVEDAIVPMPIQGVVAAMKKGRLAFVSDNGRYVIQGTVYDTWNQEEITTLEQARNAGKYIKFDKLKFNVEDLAPYTFGTGPEVVTVFVDPLCPNCHSLLKDAQALKDDFTFKVVYLPALGDESAKIVRQVHCAADQKEAYSRVVELNERANLSENKAVKCQTDALAKRLITAKMFGMAGVPFMVRGDGLVKTGYQKNELKQWLTSRSN